MEFSGAAPRPLFGRPLVNSEGEVYGHEPAWSAQGRLRGPRFERLMLFAVMGLAIVLTLVIAHLALREWDWHPVLVTAIEAAGIAGGVAVVEGIVRLRDRGRTRRLEQIEDGVATLFAPRIASMFEERNAAAGRALFERVSAALRRGDTLNEYADGRRTGAIAFEGAVLCRAWHLFLDCCLRDSLHPSWIFEGHPDAPTDMPAAPANFAERHEHAIEMIAIAAVACLAAMAGQGALPPWLLASIGGM